MKRKRLKILIFKSEVTGALYCWNGEDSVIIKEPDNASTALVRPLGKVMNQMDEDMVSEIQNTYKNNKKFFYCGEAKYKVILKK